ncbi:unnamed protein product [Arabidopsis thaliana]|uniref:Uncharacterized protein n=1 Tax=Arabidopsis thaliana TaxID=3702 RepID=A0A5S9XH01_ARATH|nr:unnamed protein product [Arabidopsis thaliana]
MKGKNKSPKKKKNKGKNVAAEEPPQNITEHNTKKCPNVGVLSKIASKKAREGPSQASQASQSSLND